jgi:hypothetical protein
MDRRQQQSERRSHHSLLRPVRAFPYFSESEGRLRAVSYPGTVASLPGWPGGSAADATPLCRRHSDRPCCHNAVSFDNSDGVSKHRSSGSGSCQRLRVDQALAIILGGHRQLIGRAAARWPCRPVRCCNACFSPVSDRDRRISVSRPGFRSSESSFKSPGVQDSHTLAVGFRVTRAIAVITVIVTSTNGRIYLQLQPASALTRSGHRCGIQ